MKDYLTLTILLLTLNLTAQMAVTDPTNTAVNKSNFLKNAAILKEAVKTVDETKKTVSLLKDAKETVEKVSNVLRDVDDITEIISMQERIISEVNKQTKKISDLNVFNAKEITDISKGYLNIINKSVKSLQIAQKVITDNLFKMNDADRLQLLKQSKNDMDECWVDIKIITRKYMSIAGPRVIKKLNNK